MKIAYRVLSWLVTLLIPLALILLGVRLVLTHVYLDIEYHMPGFPADEYGFTQQERLQWSKISWDYMLNNADISFLGDLTFPDDTPLFNARELSHMLDVKNVVRPAMWTGYAIWILLLVLALWSWRSGWWHEYLRGIQRGGWMTVGLVAVVAIFAVVSFWQFFTLFHKLFFTGDSWIFLYSDTLIRLFPLRFWQDLFLFIPILIAICGLVLGLALRPGKTR